MLKQRTIFFLGIWVAILPFLGFPVLWRKIFFVISGTILVIVSYLLYRENKNRSPKQKTPQTFKESSPDMHSSSVIQNDVEKIEETIKHEIELEKVPEIEIKSTYVDIKRRPRAPRIQAVHQREEVLNSTNEIYGDK